VTGYTLTLAGLLLFAGALGDKYDRKKIFLTGVCGSPSHRSCAPWPRTRPS
jgi:MFS family permease